MKRNGVLTILGIAVLTVLAAIFALGLFVPASRGFFPIDIVFQLVIGWLLFIVRAVPGITVDGTSVIVGIVVLAVLAGGLHKVCRYYFDKHTEHLPKRQWGFSRTAAMLAGVMLLVVVASATLGATRQIAGLLVSGQPLLYSMSDSRSSLKQLGLAAHNFHDVNRAFPAGATFDATGRPLHSWVTRLLPYVERVSLYRQIRYELPWDHPENKHPFQQPLPVVQNSAVFSHDEPVDFNAAQYALAHYAANVLVIGPQSPLRIHDMSDGTSNTVLLGEVNAHFRPWGDPLNFRDLTQGINQTPDGFGSPRAGGAYLLFADGSVRLISNDTDSAVLKAMATPAGGEEVITESP